MSISDYATVLSDCTVSNGVLRIPSISGNTEAIREVTNTLYNMLVDYKIPHYRVAACVVLDNGRVPESIIGNIFGVNQSYIEVMYSLSKIILSEKCGDFYAPDVDGVESILQVVEEAELYGHCMINNCEGLVTTSNGKLRFYGHPRQPVRCLTRDEEICYYQGNNVCIYMYYRKGTGIVEFEENGYFFRRCRNVVPCRTVYDLTEVFRIPPYVDGAKDVPLTYLKNVDETVLTEILRGVELQID